MTFKKMLAFWMSLVILISSLIPLAYAETMESTEDQETTSAQQEEKANIHILSERSVIYSCVYDSKSKKIHVSGTVNHDVMVNHSDFSIEVYRILPGQLLEDLLAQKEIEPLASSPIAVKFRFSIDASNTYFRFSKYVVVLRSPTGELLLTQATHASISTTYSYEHRDKSFKGIESLNPVIAAGINAGTVIVPVYMEKLLNSAGHGYMYSINSTYRYFDEAYITELDKQIKTYSACGTRVYLQMLLSDYSLAYQKAPSAGALYYMPDVYEEEVLSQISAFAEFLADRYGDYQSGTIDGFILGTKIDKSKMNDRQDISLEEYAGRYAFYLYVMAASARSVNSSLDIVVPFSSNNTYFPLDQEETESGNDFSPTDCLEKILEALRINHFSDLSFNMMIETSVLPATSTQGEASQTEAAEINVNNISVVLSYLENLKKTEKNLPQHVIFCWDLPKQLLGNSLASAYVYSYAALLQHPKVSAFVTNFASDPMNGTNQLLELESILSAIDTDKKFPMISSLEPMFDKEKWSYILSVLQETNQQNTVIFSTNRIDPNEISVKGSFSYFDFHNGNLGDWMPGVGCADIKSSYGIHGARIMEITMQPSGTQSREEALCLYEFYENLSHTPYIKLDLAFHSLKDASDEIYEICITIGDEKGSICYEYPLHGQDQHSVWLDLSEYNQDHVAKYIKISTRNLSDSKNNYSCSIYGFTGYSTQYSSEELADLIEKDRLSIQTADQTGEENKNLYWVTFGVFGALLAVTVILLSIYALFRKSLKKHYENDDSEINEKKL